MDSSKLPVASAVIVGDGQRFNNAMNYVARELPAMFRRLDQLNLKQAYLGLKKLRFVEALERGGSSYHVDLSRDIVSIYPLAGQMFGRADRAFYTAMGLRFWGSNLSASQKRQWDQKLITPKRATIDKIQDALKQCRFSSYKQLVDSFRTPSERLIAIHICNALTKNSIRINAAQEIDLKRYAPTRDFARSLRPYSLKPLLSAYAGKDNMKYENAFAQYCIGKGVTGIRDSSVEDGFVSLFQTVSFNR